MKKSRQFNLRMTEKELETLKQFAFRSGSSPQQLIRALIKSEDALNAQSIEDDKKEKVKRWSIY